MGGDLERCERDALAWIARLVPGRATSEDLVAFQQWYRQSPAHVAAFAKARKLSSALDTAARNIVAQEGLTALPPPGRSFSSMPSRRAVLGGGALAATAASVYLAVRPPFGLWPSISELEADYRTGTGEQRQVALTNDLSFDLNTRTSVVLRPASGDVQRVELISGEGIATAGPHMLEVSAGSGRALARNAKFDIRRDSGVIVTCVEGNVRVECRETAVTLESHQQVSYSETGIGRVAQADTAAVTAWRNGFLVFHDTPLAQVVDEVNRYRRGRIILLNAALGQRVVNGRFYLDRIDEAVEKIQGAFQARVRSLPGGIVVLS